MRVSNDGFYNSTALTSITEQDWEELMQNIDKSMGQAKDMLNEKDEKESLESQIYNKIMMTLHKHDKKDH
jgi:hypothetical protein